MVSDDKSLGQGPKKFQHILCVSAKKIRSISSVFDGLEKVYRV